MTLKICLICKPTHERFFKFCYSASYRVTNKNKHKIFPVLTNHDITDHYPKIALVCNHVVDKSIKKKFVRSF